jgi:hypothetical protein
MLPQTTKLGAFFIEKKLDPTIIKILKITPRVDIKYPRGKFQ